MTDEEASEAVEQAAHEVRSTGMGAAEKVGKLLAAQRQIQDELEHSRLERKHRHLHEILEMKNLYEARIDEEVRRLSQACMKQVAELEDRYHRDIAHLDELQRKIES